jgi:hypothetical protein
MANPEECVRMAEDLTNAFADVVCSCYIANRAYEPGDRDLRETLDLFVLRETLGRAEAELRGVVIPFIAHTLMDVE